MFEPHDTDDGAARGRGSGASRRAVLVAGALFALAAAIRFATLAHQSLWLDEAYTEHLVRMPFGRMLSAIPQTESTPPLYYVLAWLWARAFGFSAFALRTPSAIAGIVTVALTYALGRRLASPRAGLIAAALVALSPLLVWFSQEARSYALAACLGTLSLLCAVAYLQERRARWLWGWAAACAAGLATHYFVAFLVVPQAVVLVWRCGPDRRRVAGAVAVLAAELLALAPLALAQRGTGHADYIAEGSLWTRVLQIPKQLVVGYASPGQLATGAVAAALLGVGLLAAGGTLVGRPRPRPRPRAGAPLVLAAGGVCVLFPILLAAAGIDYVNTRNVLPALVPVLVLSAVGLSKLTPAAVRWATVAALAAVWLLVTLLVDTHPRFQRDDWRGASAALGAAGDRVIVVTPASGAVALPVYRPGLAPFTAPRAVAEIDVVRLPAHLVGHGLAPLVPVTVTPPPGFRLLARHTTATYDVVRFRAAAPLAVGPAQAEALLPGAAPLIQPPK